MTRLFVTLALLLAAGGCGGGKTTPSGPKPDLHLITSLPLLFGETFGLDTRQRAIIRYLEERYRLLAIDLPSQVPVNATLLMVQPRALPAEELVHLDKWVRAGGRLVLLADPRLEWQSERPLGDPLRPPAMFADTGLLLHWGLRLDAPDKAGPVEIHGVTYVSPGRFAGRGDCAIDSGAIVARCKLGTGRATIVADADWLDDVLVKRSGGSFESQQRALETLLLN
jgi:hypothetical protein